MKSKKRELYSKQLAFFVLYHLSQVTLLLNSAFDIFQQWIKVSNGAVHGTQVSVVLFRNLNAILFTQFHHNIEEVHTVQFHLLTERNSVIQVGEIFIWGDTLEDVDNHLSNLFGCH